MPLPARSTAAISRLHAAAPVPRPNDIPDPLLEIARLKRDLTSLRTRDRTQRRALFELKAGGSVPLTSVATIGPRASAGSVNALLVMAQHAERHGRVPLVRFARDAQDRIAGVELCLITPDEADESKLDTLPDGMAVVAGDEPC